MKITPLATELDADPTVCAVFASRMLLSIRAPRSRRKTATVITATGMDVEIVRPATSPR